MDKFLSLFFFRENEHRQILIDGAQQRKQNTKFFQREACNLHTMPRTNLLQLWCIRFNNMLYETVVI